MDRAIHTGSILLIHPNKTEVQSLFVFTLLTVGLLSWLIRCIQFNVSTVEQSAMCVYILCLAFHSCVGVFMTYSLSCSSTGPRGSTASARLPWLPLLSEDHLCLPHYGLNPRNTGTSIMMASVVANGNQGSQSLVLKGVDPETCMIVFKNHWAQVRASSMIYTESGSASRNRKNTEWREINRNPSLMCIRLHGIQLFVIIVHLC